ncbi:MAG: hypothetical protein HY905_01450 [Deltaproteobacteria bacterium]|nr:hypothetical protein [Deltaproteobacteria bacterium]
MIRTIALVLAFVVAPAIAAPGCGPASECTGSSDCPAGQVCYFGSCVTPAGDGGDAEGNLEVAGDDGARPDAAAEDGSGDEVAPDDTEDDATADGPDGTEEATDEDAGGGPEDAVEDDATDSPPEIEEVSDVVDLGDWTAEALPVCDGAWLGGYCWYASVADQSCDAACATHGGCNLAGTRDYAGSGGTDAQCVAVLAALGFGSYPHQDWSNNDLGCHFAWGSWTYWSTAAPTTCAAAAPGGAAAVRMCACTE